MAPTTEHRETRKPGIGDLFRLVVAAFTLRDAQKHARGSNTPRAVFAYDLIGVHTNAFGVYEGDSLDLLFEFLAAKGMKFDQATALDIGANIGNHSLYFAERFAHVIAFEPNATIRALLEFNLARIPNTEIRAYGLGDAPGSFRQTETLGNLGGSTLLTDVEGDGVDVEVRRLDDEPGLEAAFVKLDVEGFEERVLRGGETFLRRSKPVVVFEQHERDFDNGVSPSIAFLESLGYRMHWFEGGRTYSDPFWRQGLQMLRDIVLRRGRRVCAGGAPPVKTHSFIIAMPPVV